MLKDLACLLSHYLKSLAVTDSASSDDALDVNTGSHVS